METLANECAEEEGKWGLDRVRAKINFINGYKANTNKYSEEDMRHTLVSMSLQDFRSMDEEGVKKTINNHLQSLQKQPILTEIELETEIIGNPHVLEDVPIVHNKETNIITAISFK